MNEMDRAAIATKTDESALENFIADNQRFILACAARASRRFVTRSDDEWSVALMAFHEAIEAYEEGKGGFKSFAGLIIRRRVTDYLRSESRHNAEIPVEPYTLSGEVDGEDPTGLQMEVRQRSAELAEEQTVAGTNTAADEIEAAQQELARYGFSFFDLTDCSPRAAKTKQQCAQAISALLNTPELLEQMRDRKVLPIQALSMRSGVHKKVLERHRKYIIAAAEILQGDYPVLGGYLSFVRKAVT